MGEQFPDAVDALLHRFVGGGHGRYRAGFGHSVANRQLGEIEGFVQFSHQLGRDAGSGHDAGSEMLEPPGVGLGYGAVLEQLELGDEHCGDSVEGGAFLFLNACEGGVWVEGFTGKDDG